MTTLTLEEIEALAAEANASGETTRMRAMEFPRLLAIAQEQRGAMAADEERTRAAAMRVWGEHVRGCDTADAMADLIVSQRAEIAAMRKVIDIARVCANEGGYKECPRTDDHHIALLEMDQAIKNIGTKR